MFIAPELVSRPLVTPAPIAFSPVHPVYCLPWKNCKHPKKISLILHDVTSIHLFSLFSHHHHVFTLQISCFPYFEHTYLFQISNSKCLLFIYIYTYIYIYIYIQAIDFLKYIYLVVLGLSCSARDLNCGIYDLSLHCVGFSSCGTGLSRCSV